MRQNITSKQIAVNPILIKRKREKIDAETDNGKYHKNETVQEGKKKKNRIMETSIHINIHMDIIVQSPRHIQLIATPWSAPCQACLSHAISQNLLNFMSMAGLIDL